MPDELPDRLAGLLALLDRLVLGQPADGVTPYADLQRRAVDEIAAQLGGAAALWLVQDGVPDLVAFANPDPLALADMHRIAAGLVHRPDGLVASVLRGGEVLRAAADEVARLVPLMDRGYGEFLTLHGGSGLVVVPLAARGTAVGALGVLRPAGRPGLTEADAAHLRQVGAVLALVLDNARLLQDAEVAARQAARLALTDELTGLPNRRALQDGLRAALGQDAASGACVGVLVLDLDGFKLVNDGFGHAAGDAVLVQVAHRLRAHLVDVGPAGTLLARTGGDEFAVLLVRTTPEQALSLAADVVAASRADLRVLGLAVPLQASVGVATRLANGDPDGADALLRHADLAMYRAKRGGAGCAAYDDDLDAAAGSRLRDVAELVTAIEQRDLELHYQLLVDVQGRWTDPVRVEALVRWRRGGTLLPPAAFLPLAEQAGLMPALTEAVLDLAVADTARWRDDGVPVRCSVNVPAVALHDGLADRVLARLAAAGLPVSALVLELTESELVDRRARDGLRECAARGLTVAVDDFGTGWSSLTHLVDLPLRALKLDAALVRGVHLSLPRRLVVRHVVAICHELGVRVIAEGVEEAAEALALRELGLDLLQGFLFSRPQPAHLLLAGRTGAPPGAPDAVRRSGPAGGLRGT